MKDNSFYHDAEYRRKLLALGITRLLDEHSMNKSQLVKVLNEEFGFTKMTPSLFSKMFSLRSSQKQNPDLAVILAIAEYFDVPVSVLFNGGSTASLAVDIYHHLTYRDLFQLLYWLDRGGIIEMTRHENEKVNTGDPEDVLVSITPGQKADGTLAHFLSMYTSAKETVSTDTPEGKRVMTYYLRMLVKGGTRTKVFSETNADL